MLPVSTVGKDDGSGSFIAPAPVSGIGLSQNTEFVSDDATTTTTKKVRKPYTIKKTRESWSEQEHEKFIESLQLFDRDWKKIEAFVGSKTVIQIRSHAQKYFLKIQKDGTNDHIPPPRPKRKAAHPYPQKASKNDNRGHVGSSKNAPNKNFCSSSGKDFTDDWGHVGSSKNAPNKNFYSSSGKDDWGHVGSSKNAPNKNFCSSSGKDDWGHVGSSKNAPNKNCCSSSGSPSETWPISETSEQIRNIPANRAIPDFVQVHQFIGSVLDPDTEDNHMETLKQMESIDVETVLLLMKNLTVNLENPDFEEHRKLLSYYSDQMQ